MYPLRSLLRLVLPAIAVNLTQPLLALADSAIAGHFAEPEKLAGVAMGGLLFNLLFWGFGFLRMATAGLVAQAYGAGDRDAIGLVLARMLALCLLFGGGLLSLRGTMMDAGLGWLGGTGAVLAVARDYVGARLWSLPMALANATVLGLLLGCQSIRLALWLQLLINGINAVVALAWVFVFDGGVAAIGAATALADGAGFLFALVLLRGMGLSLRGLRWRNVFAGKALARLMTINLSLFCRTLALILTLAEFSRAGAGQGEVVFAANSLLLNLNTFVGYALDGFAHVTQTLVGSALGGGQGRRLRAVVVSGMLSAAAVALGGGLLLWFGGPLLLGWLTSMPGVYATALVYLPWLACLPCVAVWGFLLDGVFMGATRVRLLLVSMVTATVLFLLLVPSLLAAFGNHGLWAAFLAFMAMRGVVLAVSLPGLLRTALRQYD